LPLRSKQNEGQLVSKPANLERRASCSCGQLRVVVQVNPVRISACHCLECQRRTGSIFGVQARFPKNETSIQGESSVFTRTGDSGDEISFRFCPRCGSTVYYTLAKFPDIVAIPVGAFADPNFPEPQVSFYESRRHAWVQLPVRTERFKD
jgi:hypothetical protein